MQTSRTCTHVSLQPYCPEMHDNCIHNTLQDNTWFQCTKLTHPRELIFCLICLHSNETKYISVHATSTTNRKISVKNWFIRASNYSKRLTSATNRAFSVQHACGLSTTPTPQAAHAQAQCWKGSSNHETALK